MRLYLDCEFNEFGGELISMALVSNDGREWYRVLQEPRVWGAWVYENVFPVLGEKPIGQEAFTYGLKGFLENFNGCEIIADWPADFQHLAEQMSIIGKILDFNIPIECTMTLLRGSTEIKPEIPHNALSDARALRDWHMRVTQGAGACHFDKWHGHARMEVGF